MNACENDCNSDGDCASIRVFYYYYQMDDRGYDHRFRYLCESCQKFAPLSVSPVVRSTCMDAISPQRCWTGTESPAGPGNMVQHSVYVKNSYASFHQRTDVATLQGPFRNSHSVLGSIGPQSGNSQCRSDTTNTVDCLSSTSGCANSCCLLTHYSNGPSMCPNYYTVYDNSGKMELHGCRWVSATTGTSFGGRCRSDPALKCD